MDSEVGREPDRTEPDDTSDVTVKGTGQIWFPTLFPGSDTLIFISTEKHAVKTDHTWYYKDWQDQIKSSTTAERLKDSLVNPASLDTRSRVTEFVLLPLVHSQILGLAYKLV